MNKNQLNLPLTSQEKCPSNLRIKEELGYVAGILYTTQKMVTDLTRASGPLAVVNEYQVHWEGVTFRLSDNEGFIDITVPTVVFNYPQEVSTAAIGFSLKDVLQVRETIKPLAALKQTEAVSKFLPQIKTFATTYGLQISLVTNAMSNIHRHPGSMKTFSGTDYDTNPDNPGIVFPFKSAEKAGIFSSIIIHQPNAKLCHTEYRVADKVGDILTYYKGACYTYCKGHKLNVPSTYAKFLQATNEVNDFSLANGDTFNKEIIDNINTIFSSVDYEPDTKCVLSSNLGEKKYVKAGVLWNNRLGHWDDDEDYGLSKYPSTAPKSKAHIPHVGRLPLLSNLITYQTTYGNKIFTTVFGKFLGNDIVDAWMDYEADIRDSFVKGITEEPRSVEEFLGILEKDGLLDMYEYPYTSKAAGVK